MKIIDLECDTDGVFKPTKKNQTRSEKKAVDREANSAFKQTKKKFSQNNLGVEKSTKTIDVEKNRARRSDHEIGNRNIATSPIEFLLETAIGQLERETKKLIRDIFR